jgi:ABC-2 type transport system ATP-binding protein
LSAITAAGGSPPGGRARLGTLTKTCDEITLLADGLVRRHYLASEFGSLATDPLDTLYQDKLAPVAALP